MINFLVTNRRGDLIKQDFYQKKGGLQTTLPTPIGSQGVGGVESIGPEVDNIQVRDRVVCAGGSGTYASHVLIPSKRLIPIPDGISFEQAAAGLIQGFLAWAFTHDAYPIKKMTGVWFKQRPVELDFFYAKWKKFVLAASLVLHQSKKKLNM
ncbi:alcohol dehydrogenase catalytic domain-containing protein [Bacillus bingmayongensis]|uniref:alcohol dehydrogenase catalytic domain-containing protein n=1 Tax=Bacillus bingmayongensis TaxID=1150157 RepID=UPI0021AF18DD|nr:hypothetical protein [Bacillus bingmayongensis]